MNSWAQVFADNENFKSETKTEKELKERCEMSRLSGREQAVWDKRNAGLTFKEIAKDLGLCPATVSFAYRKAYRKIEYGKAMKISKLTEYENIGSVEDFKQLKHELEVYKRALKNKIPSNYYELEKYVNMMTWNRFDKKDYIHRGEKATERDYYYYTNGVSAVLENEVKQLKSELEVYKRALELALISRKEMLEKQNCFTCSVEKAKIEFLEQAEEALRKVEGK